uniref:tissue factor pathway inhibitor a n=1 Tax=Centroberyx gerrardi TaxID=166262 RepID=UPI003AAA4BB3
MAQSNKWWILSVVSLACLGSCNTAGRAHGAQPERFIFNELCAMKDDPGHCKAIKDRFFFDIDTGRCAQFEYGGCGGNANNFETLEDCEEMCVVSADKSPCHLAEAPGPCRGLVTRYFFDSESQECKHFFYGGCFGNANNFRSMAECQAKCQNPGHTTKVPEVEIAQPTRKSKEQPIRVTEEFALSQPQVHLDASHRPTEFIPPEFCLAPLHRGTCDGAERRFAYDPKTKRCHMFRYSGCGGNKNNFTHRRHCLKMCMNIRNHGTRMIRIRKKNINSIVFRSV